MKLSTLLAQRAGLLRQARLANTAYAYATLARFNARVARARLRGTVALKSAAPELERYGATLSALAGSQAVLDEHFSDEDLMELADVVAFATGQAVVEETFRLDEIPERFLAPLRSELERNGVAFDECTQQPV